MTDSLHFSLEQSKVDRARQVRAKIIYRREQLDGAEESMRLLRQEAGRASELQAQAPVPPHALPSRHLPPGTAASPLPRPAGCSIEARTEAKPGTAPGTAPSLLYMHQRLVGRGRGRLTVPPPPHHAPVLFEALPQGPRRLPSAPAVRR